MCTLFVCTYTVRVNIMLKLFAKAKSALIFYHFSLFVSVRRLYVIVEKYNYFVVDYSVVFMDLWQSLHKNFFLGIY